MNSYNPNYFFERNEFVEKCRSDIENGEYKNEEWRNISQEIINTYEFIIDLYRDYEDCYNEKDKKKALKKFENARDVFFEALDQFKIIAEKENVGIKSR